MVADAESLAAERAALIAEFGTDASDDVPHELDRVDAAHEVDERVEDDDADAELDANAAALAELDRRSLAESASADAPNSLSPAVESAAPAAEASPASRRPPTLAVIIARGADF